jgi:hypothetical protein
VKGGAITAKTSFKTLFDHFEIQSIPTAVSRIVVENVCSSPKFDPHIFFKKSLAKGLALLCSFFMQIITHDN